MASPNRRRLLVAIGIAAISLLLLAGIVAWQLLDPGSKHDTSTDLVTPTIASRTARAFEVAAGESQVDFVAEVGGIKLNGVFPVEAGTITLEPVGGELRVLVRLNINVDAVSTGNAAVDRVLRASMETGNYPISFYVAASRTLVPVTEEEITFDLDGTLEVHNVEHEHSMTVRAQLVGEDMWAIATSDLDLGNHGVEFPNFFGSTTIQLTARLQAYETEMVNGTSEPEPHQ